MTLKVYAFTTGWITLPLGSFLEGEKGKLKVPVPCYLIEHPKGRVLFDSGLHIDTQTDYKERLGAMSKYFTVHFEPGEEISAQLARVDLSVDDIDLVINSHLHYDHAGGNEQLPNSRVLVQRREWEAAHDADLIAANAYLPADYDHGHVLELVNGEHDVFGDGCLSCLPTHGHTPGHQSLRIRTGSKNIVLCGDACYLRRSLEELRLPLVVHDREAMMESLVRLRMLRDRGARIFYGHDPEFWADVPQAPKQIL
jgi:glyoxylase-like metal-dependent hydrolase (beta-lactamase superfamily II)